MLTHKNCRLEYGATRCVLLVGTWAIKAPAMTEWRLFLLGLLANMQERLFWQTRWPELCPVLWSIPGGWLVVMRRARVMTESEFAEFDVESFTQCGSEDGQYVVPVEPKADSFGYLDGRVVAVDYGN